MTKAYSYIRMSTEVQLKGDSARRQLAMTERYAREHGLELVEVLLDPGKSAFRGRNTEFGAALAKFRDLVDQGRIERGSFLIVESLDRLSRQNVTKAFDLLRDIVSRGIVVVTLNDGQRYGSDSLESISSLFIALGSMMRAHEESKIKSERVGAAWKQKKLNAAKKVFVTRRLPAWLLYDEVSKRITINEERAAVVREIFAKVCSGWGAYSIARDLNTRGVPPWSTRHRAVWRESYIKKIIKGRAVLGEYHPHRLVYEEDGKSRRVADGDPVVDYYPSVVTLELYERAQAAVASRRLTGAGRKGASYANVFTGLLRCGACGAGISYLDKGPPPKGGRYLRCSVANSRGNCAAPAWRYELIEESLLSAMDSLDVSYILGGKTREMAIREVQVELSRAERTLSHLESNIRHTAEAIRQGSGAGSTTLVQLLAEDEGRLRQVTVARDELLARLHELQSFDAGARRKQLDQLLDELSRDRSSDDSAAIRRALAAEIRLSLTKIVIKPIRREAWELIDDKPRWMERLGKLTQEELQAACDQLNFEFVFVYRNGRDQFVDPLSEEWFEMRRSMRFDVLRAMHRARSM